LALLAGALCAAACGFARAEPLWISHCVGGLESDAVGLIAEAFSETAAIPTRVTADEEAEMYARLIARKGEALPDIIITSSQRLPFLADAGRILALDDAVAGAPWEDYIPGVLDSVAYRGKRWGIPIEANPYGLFCNLDLFREAAIKELPLTWQETLAAAERLTADTDGDGVIDRWGYTQCAFQLPLLLFAYGCDYLNPAGTDAGFNNESGLAALRLYVRLRRLSPSVNFERGDIGMKMSVLDNLARYAHLNYDVIGVPRGKVKANSFGGSDGALCLAVVAGPRREQALAFVGFWMRPEMSLRWSTSSDNIPLCRSILDSPAYQRYLAERPRVRALVAELPYCRPRPCRKAYVEIKEALALVANEAVARRDPSDAELRALLESAAARVRTALAAERAD
jgi:multiple sugar transport system substrate-binding protein